MPTLRAKPSPGSRRDTGDHVLSSAKSANVKPVAKKMTAFASVHKAFCKADDEVARADADVRRAQARVGEADVAQDDAVALLASALAGDGAPRTRPFAALGFGPPSEIQALGYAKEASVAKKLAATVTKAKASGLASKRAAAALAKAADAVTVALKPVAGLEKARTGAIAQREALGQAWETAFASLKRAARVAEDDGARGLFDALFTAPSPRAPASKTKKAKKNGAAPGPTTTTNATPS